MIEKKTITVSIACYNEEENVVQMAEAVIKKFENELSNYDYIIQFIDNCSTDSTRLLLKKLCAENLKIRAIFNARNFGGISGYHGLLQTDTDCSIVIPCDFQVPLDLLPVFVAKWEEGSNIVCGIKTTSKENPIMRGIRNIYYKLVQKFSDIKVIEHFSGSGLYDKSFLDLCRKVDDPAAYLTQIICTLGSNIATVEFEEQRRARGKTKNNLWTLFDSAIFRFVSFSKVGPRVATLAGLFVAAITFFIGIVFLILKLIYWNRFSAGIAPLVILFCMISAVQLFFIGLIGEYVVHINTRLMKNPRVVEECRINFENQEEQ